MPDPQSPSEAVAVLRGALPGNPEHDGPVGVDAAALRVLLEHHSTACDDPECGPETRSLAAPNPALDCVTCRAYFARHNLAIVWQFKQDNGRRMAQSDMDEHMRTYHWAHSTDHGSGAAPDTEGAAQPWFCPSCGLERDADAHGEAVEPQDFGCPRCSSLGDLVRTPPSPEGAAQ